MNGKNRTEERKGTQGGGFDMGRAWTKRGQKSLCIVARKNMIKLLLFLVVVGLARAQRDGIGKNIAHVT